MLREAGVVDAGGYGLTVLLAGIVGALRGGEAPRARAPRRRRASPTRSTPRPRFRYCTNFAVSGAGLEQRPFISELEQIGDSVLVVGDPTTLKVHVHTDDPDAATALFADAGVVSHLDVADMREQVQARDERLRRRRRRRVCGALAVVNGDGMRALFESFGVRVLDGGPTLNPSTYDLLAAIHAVPAEQVVVLPNSANVVMAAERAAELSDKTVASSPPARSRPGWRPRSASIPAVRRAENAAAMLETLARVRTGAVAPAARDDARAASATGDAVGFVDERAGRLGRAARRRCATCSRSWPRTPSWSPACAAPMRRSTTRPSTRSPPTRSSSSCREGGQPSYWWLLSAE